MFWPGFKENYEEQIVQESALDGTVMQVRSEAFGRVCLNSNARGCQLYECFCYNLTI